MVNTLVMSQDPFPNLLASLHSAQTDSKAYEQASPQAFTQSQFPITLSSQQYLSPYAIYDVDNTRHSSGSLQPIDSSGKMSTIAIADKVNEVIARAKANGGKEVKRGSLEWETAREVVLADMQSAGPGILPPWVNVIDNEPYVEARTGGRRGRGPRRRGSPIAVGTIKVDPSTGEPAEISLGGRARGRGRGGRGGRPRGSRGIRGSRGSTRGGKRKRSGDEDEKGDDNEDTDASETFAPLPTQSRSGRKIFQAHTIPPIIKIDGEAVVGPSSSSVNRLNLNETRKKNKSSYRRPPGANALCKNCDRGHSPSSNVIVFCDGCNTPWHQYCHDPPIKGEIVQIEEKEWFCADCMVIRENDGRLEGRVSGDGLSLTEVCIIWITPFYSTSSVTKTMLTTFTEATISPNTFSREPHLTAAACLHHSPFSAHIHTRCNTSRQCFH